MRAQGRPEHLHGLPYDGSPAGEGTELVPQAVPGSHSIAQWVGDIADAGGSLYCFHLEATCERASILL